MEGQILSYSILAGLTLAILFLVYRVFMARAKQPRLNRMLLLGICGFSFLVVPCADAYMSREIPEEHGIIAKPTEIKSFRSDVDIVPTLTSAVKIADTDTNDPVGIGLEMINGVWIKCLLSLYFGGLLLCGLIWGIGMLRLANLIRRSERINVGEAILVITKRGWRGSPFSFGRYVVMSRDVYESEEGSMVMLHELTHVRHNHWIDLVVGHLCVWICWYNPFAWMLLKAIKDTHEYEVDASMVEEIGDARTYQMMLIKRVGGARLQPYADNLNHSKLKLRITMMQKSNSRLRRRLCAVALLPAVALALSLTQTPSVAAVLTRIGDFSFSRGKDSNFLANDKVVNDFRDVFYENNDVDTEGFKAESPTAVSDEKGESTGDEPAPEIVEEATDMLGQPEDVESRNELPSVYVDSVYVGAGTECIKNMNPSDIASMCVDKSHGDMRIYIDTKAGKDSVSKGTKEGNLNVRLLNFNNYDGGVNVEVEITGTTSLEVSRCRLINDGKSYDAKSVSMEGNNDVFVLKAKFKKMKEFRNVSLVFDTDRGPYSCKIISAT